VLAELDHGSARVDGRPVGRHRRQDLAAHFDAASGKAAIPMVSAWATANHISLGQIVVDAKSNEITAIPQLLARGPRSLVD
jgi:hypothetical protein